MGRRDYSRSMRIRLAVAVSVLVSITSIAQSRRPMAINDLIGAIRVADPQLSPDGRKVIYQRTTMAQDTGAHNADIWVVPADGSAPPKAFLTGAKSENTP